MNCDEVQERMIDILYGEEVNARTNFTYFRHLADCPGCDQEYMELLRTREQLAEWTLEDAPEVVGRKGGGPVPFSRPSGRNWWGALQKIAAAFLIVVGAVSILHSFGYLGGKRLLVTQQPNMLVQFELSLSNQEQSNHPDVPACY